MWPILSPLVRPLFFTSQSTALIISTSYVVPLMTTYGLLNRLDDQDNAPVSIWSDWMLSSSAAISGEPSSSCSARTLSLTEAYAVTAFCGLYPWSLSTNCTLRPHTPPLALRSSQNSVRPCSTALPSPAYGPVRSVSTPRVMVVSVTPGPVASLPALGLDDVSTALVLQPAAANTATSEIARTARRLVKCISSIPYRFLRNRLATRRPRPAAPPGSIRSSRMSAMAYPNRAATAGLTPSPPGSASPGRTSAYRSSRRGRLTTKKAPTMAPAPDPSPPSTPMTRNSMEIA